MTDQEFIVLDELYFVQSFEELKEMSGLEANELSQVLQGLLEKGWIRCLDNPDQELDTAKTDFPKNLSQYFFLATKAGLLAHNSR